MTHDVSIGFFYITGPHEFCYTITEEGWYWWEKKDSSLPDTNPIGPFNTFYEAERNANERSDGYQMRGTIC